MIADALLTFADNLAVNTGAAGNYTIGDQIDLQAIRNVGNMSGGGDLFLVITAATALTSGGAATNQFSLITDDNGAMSSPNVLASGPVNSLAQSGAGAILAVLPLPSSDATERYLGLRQTTGTAAFTGGTVNAFITPTPPVRRAYADGLPAGA